MTLVLRSQATGIRPEFPVNEEQHRRAVGTPDGAIVRRYRQVNQRALRVIEFTWDTGSRGQMEQLQLLWKQACGPVAAMDFTPLGDVDANKYRVRFLEAPEIEQTSAKTWRLRARFEEVL